MRNLYSSDQSKQMDLASQQSFSIPGASLMEAASLSAYLMIREDLRNSKGTVFLAGGGNNGGDCLAIARFARLDGIGDIRILLCDSGRETELRAIQREACSRMGIEFAPDAEEALEGADILVDGLFGIGLKGRPRDREQCLITAINSRKTRVISLDVPSGLGDNVPFGCAIKAYRTICMGELKTALYLPGNREFAGLIETTFPLFPEGAKPQPGATLLEDGDLAPTKFGPNAYKKTRGSIAIVGGSGRFTGAVVLAAKAAFHAGAGLVTVFTEDSLVPTISKAIPSAMVTTYSQATDLGAFDAVLCGPGMGKDHDQALSTALSQARRLVVDADGVRAFARLGARASAPCIMTPHLGEYAALLGTYCPDMETDSPEGWLKALERVGELTNSSLVVKADTVWIRTALVTAVVDGQNPSLGVAGSGDVLAGVMAALCGSGDQRAAHNAVLMHQRAGRKASGSLGFYSSDELVRFIGRERQF